MYIITGTWFLILRGVNIWRYLTFIPSFSGVRVALYFTFFVMFCRSLFVLLFFSLVGIVKHFVFRNGKQFLLHYWHPSCSNEVSAYLSILYQSSLECVITPEGVIITIWFLHQEKLLRNVRCLLSNEINTFLHEVW
jgi:hypothetical protein